MKQWKWKRLLFILVAALLLPGMQQAGAEAPEGANLETRMVLDLGHERLPNSRVGGLASNGEFYLYIDYHARLYKSEDGLHWRRITVNEASYDYFYAIARQLIWDGKQFVLLLDNQLLSSEDGIDWKNHTPVHPNPSKEYLFRDVIYANGQYIILAQDRDRNAQIYFPGPNTIFVGESLSELQRASKQDFSKSIAGELPLDHVVWAGNRYLAGGDGSANSDDGKVWRDGGLGYGYNAVWDGTLVWEAYRNKIVAYDPVTYEDRIAYEVPEGGENITFTTIGHNGRSYIAAGYRDRSLPGIALYSKDGAKWQTLFLGDESDDIHTIFPTPHGYLLAGNRIWYVSETAIDRPSQWAASELEKAKANKLVTSAVDRFYQSDISRQDFSILAVNLYEVLTGRRAEAPQTNPFRDTVHASVLKANKLGIISGQEPSRFGPSASITRQDLAVILYRTLQKAGLQPNAASTWKARYTDLDQVAPYAEEALRFLNHEGIISGVSADRLAPTGNATREEAIIITNRVYERFREQIDTYTGPGSVSQTLFVPEDPGTQKEVTFIHRAVNLDGRFIWAGEAILEGDDLYVPLVEFAESLDMQVEWDSDTFSLILSWPRLDDFENQTSTGIGEKEAFVPFQPRQDMAQWHSIRLRTMDNQRTVSLPIYDNEPYISIKILASEMGLKYRTENVRQEFSMKFAALYSSDMDFTYIYWDEEGFKHNGWFGALKVGERYLVRYDGGWNGKAELRVATGDPSNLHFKQIETGWIITAVKPGFNEISITNLVTGEQSYAISIVNE